MTLTTPNPAFKVYSLNPVVVNWGIYGSSCLRVARVLTGSWERVPSGPVWSVRSWNSFRFW